MAPESQQVWLITGTSTGFGKHLVTSVLARGDRVIATVRNREDFSISDADPSRVYILLLDVTESEDSVRKKLGEAWNVWGRIDILVNNAGYVSQCLIEEGGLSEAMAQFEVNFFGVLKVTNAVLPYMRARKSGLIVMIGSRSVWQANIPTGGFYIASKAAIHSFSETLAAEYDGFREDVVKMIHEFFIHARSDPAKAMEVFTDVVRREGRAEDLEPLSLLLLGPTTFTQARLHAKKLEEAASKWEGIGKHLDFD